MQKHISRKHPSKNFNDYVQFPFFYDPERHLSQSPAVIPPSDATDFESFEASEPRAFRQQQEALEPRADADEEDESEMEDEDEHEHQSLPAPSNFVSLPPFSELLSELDKEIEETAYGIKPAHFSLPPIWPQQQRSRSNTTASEQSSVSVCTCSCGDKHLLP